MKLLIKNGLVVDPADKIESKIDIAVNNGKIVKKGKALKLSGAKTIDAKGLVVMPGFVEMHAHFREPGFEYKETIETGSLAAAKGGYTSVCCMPNTNPVIDTQAMVEFIKLKSKQVGIIDVLPIGTITKGGEGKEISAIGELYKAGAVAISDDGACVINSEVLRRALEYSKMFDMPVIEHCEDNDLSADGMMHEGYYSTLLGLRGIPAAAEETMIARDIILARETGGRIHIAHVSTAGSVELIKWAKGSGVKVTAEAAPHHFSLDDSSLQGYDSNFKMKPPLRSAEDVKAVKKALKDGTIDVIATDHAPHAELDKKVEFMYAAFGIIGLETAFPVIVTNLINTNVLTLSQAVAKITINPSSILKLKAGTLSDGADADITIADLNAKEKITKEFFASKSINSPFIGSELSGKIEMTIKKGRVVYRAGM